MNREAIAAVTVMFVPFLASCAGFLPLRPSETPALPGVMADTFFSGCAYLDENGNGAIDAEEPIVGGVAFTVTLAGGTGFGGATSEGRCAFITIPADLREDAWPILARMEAPKESPYEPIGPSEIILEYRDTRADFLFTLK